MTSTAVKPFGEFDTWTDAVESIIAQVGSKETEKRAIAISELMRCAEIADLNFQPKGFTILFKELDEWGGERTNHNGFFSDPSDAEELFRQQFPTNEKQPTEEVHEPRLCTIGQTLSGYLRVKPKVTEA